MKISKLQIDLHIPIKGKSKIVNILELVKDKCSISNLTSYNFEGVTFLSSRNKDRLISIGPSSNISILFNPKNITDEKIKVVEEEVNDALKIIKKEFDFNHLHQSLHIHFKDLKLVINPLLLVKIDKIKKRIKNNKLKPVMLGLSINTEPNYWIRTTFYEKGTIGTVVNDYKSSHLSILDNKKTFIKFLEPLIEK